MGDILFLAHRVPYPPNRGDKIRSYNILRYLSERHRVHLLAFGDDIADCNHAADIAHFTDSAMIIPRVKPRWLAGIQAVLQGKPVSLAAFDVREMRVAVDRMLSRYPIDTIYVFSGQMAQYLPDRPGLRIIMDFVDVDSAKFDSYACLTGGIAGWVMAREARLLADYERIVASRADASIFVSEAEAELFADRSGVTNATVVENGIDTLLFDPDGDFEPLAKAERLIVFIGQMDYRPNIDAVQWFANDILPGIQGACAGAHFAIVGRKPSEAVKALAQRKGVIVTGDVDDVRGWLAAAAVVVAPLRVARGVQNKILEAMAMARPVVATSDAANGIDHGGTIVVGDSASQFSGAVIGLLTDPDRAGEIGRAARAQVQARYGWAARLAPLDTIINPAAVPPVPMPSAVTA
ncbi:MAG: TIGR03087 family PEP-CTERM/XrtA system glycosyltransferase [Sphingomonas sp.]|nr:TIGR03087 family PEP-CTERM/XrtA system glycosyltransferase [Sphingomonas sp.]